MTDTRIWIASDHGGYDAKQLIIQAFSEKGHEFNDTGCFSRESCKYPLYAAHVCEAVASGKAGRGVLVCSTGIGMSIFANKYKGVRASLCTDAYMARMTRLHNNSNILCIGGKITGDNVIKDIVEQWLAGGYEGGRHEISLGMISSAEDAMMNGAYWLPDND